MKPLPPKPFCINPQNVKAFVLGCDPTAFDSNGNRLEFEYVFDLGKDQRYFASVLKNLALLGLSLNDIYVQNLISEYQEKETTKNKHWKKAAQSYIQIRKKEFDAINPEKNLPVFLTAHILYELLVNDNLKGYTAEQLYNLEKIIPIQSGNNKLGRPLIPLFRHNKYQLKNWESYTTHLKQLF